jgi:Protein of unknown function (DUF3501)
MKPVTQGELLDLVKYEQVRDRFRARVIEAKRARRVPLGEHMTVLFENHDTVLLQIQEMIRTERITGEKAIAHELETYNELIAAPNELSATIFIEYPDAEERDRMLVELAGIEDSFYVTVGGEHYPVRGDQRGRRSDRTMAVQYVKFPLSAGAAARIAKGEGPVVIGVDHAGYQAETELGPLVLGALGEDLTGS